MRSPLFVGGAAAFAGDLTLLFPAHRSESATFLACSVHSTLPMVRGLIKPSANLSLPQTPSGLNWLGFKACARRTRLGPTVEIPWKTGQASPVGLGLTQTHDVEYDRHPRPVV